MTRLRIVTTLAMVVTAFAIVGRTPRAGATPVLYFNGQSCADRSVSLSFRWEAIAPDAQQAWIDLTTSDGDWDTFAADHLDVTALRDNKVDWAGRKSLTYYYARLNQQLSDGSWESSASVGFETQQCGRGPLGVPPEILGFSAGPIASLTHFEPPDGTVNRSCGPDHLNVLLRIQTPVLPFAALGMYKWYVDGRLQPYPTPAGMGQKDLLILSIPVDSVPAYDGAYAGSTSIEFPNSDPVTSAQVSLTCS